jgi:glycolate oxidase FAD binding subunit
MRVVPAGGHLTRAGGRVVKNVAGYDLCKLYIGSLGTLGVIVEATFKTVPLPRAERGIALGFANAAGPCALIARATAGGLALRSAALSRERGAWRLDLGLAGMPHAVERTIADLKQRADDPPPPSEHALAVSASLVARLSVLPSKLAALLTEVPADLHVDADPATGTCHISAATDALASIQALASKHSATCVIERCPPGLKRETDVFGKAPSSLSLMRAIKREFDPNGILSPGRMVGRI